MNGERTTTEGQVMGVIGIVLGAVSMVVAFIPCIGVVALIPGVLAITFSIISITQANRGNGAKGLGIAALIVSILSVLLAVLWLMVIGGGSFIANKAMREKVEFNFYESELPPKHHDANADTARLTDEHIKRLRELEDENPQ